MMKDRISHIIRLAIIGILFAGISAHLMSPFFGDAKKTAFTQWLNQNVVTTGDDSKFDLRNRIKQLPEEAPNFWGLLQDASRLIADHKDDFRFGPFTSASDDGNVSSWLIGQWSFYNNQSSDTDAVLNEIRSSIYKWISHVSNGHSHTLRHFLPQLSMPAPSGIIGIFTISAHSVSPLISGISINAP